MALRGDEWKTSRYGRLNPGQSTPVRTELDAEWAAESLWTF